MIYKILVAFLSFTTIFTSSVLASHEPTKNPHFDWTLTQNADGEMTEFKNEKINFLRLKHKKLDMSCEFWIRSSGSRKEGRYKESIRMRCNRGKSLISASTVECSKKDPNDAGSLSVIERGVGTFSVEAYCRSKS